VQAVRIPVTVSIGVAVYPDHGATGAAVLEAAADALYQAKRAGRDVYRVAQVRAFRAGGPGAGGTGAGGTGAAGTGSLGAASVTPSGTPGAPAPPRARRGG
jgi:hypothetical protein